MRIFFTAAFLLLGIFCRAAHTDTAGNKSLLWKISGNGLAKPSYLFGTIHLICPDDFLWTDTMTKYLKVSEKVCFEMDLDDPAVLQEVMAAFADTASSKPARKSLTPAQIKVATRILHDSLNLDLEDALNNNPTALQMMLLTKLIRCNMPASYESHIMTNALQAGKEIIGLESAREQLAALNGMESDSAGTQLVEMLQTLQAARTLYAAMVAAYVSQDLPRLYNFMIQSPELKGNIAALLDDRNRRWIGRMTPVMKQHSVFYAVGAGHLWGDAGVIHLLQQAGYTVSPLR